MKRYGLVILSLGMVCFWLIGSYIPQNSPIVFHLPLSDSILGTIAIWGFVLFLGIQVWIWFSTRSALNSKPDVISPETGTANIHLHRGVELFWTFLPIVITVMLAGCSWLFWQVR